MGNVRSALTIAAEGQRTVEGLIRSSIGICWADSTSLVEKWLAAHVVILAGWSSVWSRPSTSLMAAQRRSGIKRYHGTIIVCLKACVGRVCPALPLPSAIVSIVVVRSLFI